MAAEEQSPSNPKGEGVTEPLIGLITLSFNGMAFLGRHLDSLQAQDYARTKLVVVDNGSTDGSAQYLERVLPASATLVRNQSNLGCAEGYNLGAAACTDVDILCFLNQDTVLDAGFCGIVVNALQAAPNTVAVQPLVLFLDRPELVENCGHSVDQWMSTETIGHLHQYDPSDVRSGAMVTLTAPAIWRADFDRLGGFDEKLFIYYEDTDLSLRIWEWGGRIRFEPAAVVYHVQAASAKHFSDAWHVYLYARNRIRLLWKHGDTFRGRLRPLAAMIGGCCLALLILPRRPSLAAAIIRAIWWNLRHFRENEGARQKVMRGRIRSMRDLTEVGVLRRPGRILSVANRAIHFVR